MGRFQFVLLGLILVSAMYLVPAAAEDEDDLGLEQVQIDKAQVAQMLELMQAQGQISAEDAAKAKQELSQKSDADMQNLQKNAMERINSGDIPTLPPPAAKQVERVPAAVPSAAPSVPSAPVPPKAQAPLDPKPVEDRSKKLQDAFKFINQ